MIGSPSSEFIALCQSQVLLLTQTLGAASTVVYLIEATVETISPTLIPLVAYPETANLWHDLGEGLAAVFNTAEADGGKQSPIAQPEQWLQQPAGSARDSVGLSSKARISSENGFLSMPFRIEPTTQLQGVETEPTVYPLVLPLAHDGVVLGMIVSTREALPWTSDDYRRAEQVASTLAIAYVLDQRSQWLQRQLNQRQLIQADQSETFHDLLHQFRNPLTALQTFGKLMVKRLPPEDTNRPIVEGIVRESRRVQDLAEHFDAAVAEGDETLEQATTPPASRLLLPGSSNRWSDRPSAVVDSDADTSNGRLAMTQGQLLETLAPATGHGLGRSLKVQPGAIAEIALPLVQSIVPLAHERGLHLVHHILTPLPMVWLDAAALREVLHNLLDNALKYAPAGSLIWVTAGLVQRFGRQMFQGIAVGDTGAGIPQSDQPQLFTRHFRGVRAQGNIPGTGLGLTIVQDLVQGMGGHIDLVSPVQGTPWLPPEAIAYPQNPGVVFVVWLKALNNEE